MKLPSREEYLANSGGESYPLMAILPADTETPLSAYWKLAHRAQESFLLESVSGGENIARYSFVGINPQNVIRVKGDRVIDKSGERSLAPGTDPLDCLTDPLSALQTKKIPGLPKFYGGAIGVLGYDIVRCFETLPDSNEDHLHAWDLAMMMVGTLVVFDHVQQSMKVVAHADGTEVGYDQARADIQAIFELLSGPLPNFPTPALTTAAAHVNVEREQFEGAVRSVIDDITEGECIQVVLSQRLAKPTQTHAVSIYRSLRRLNPSPYLFLLRFGDFDLIGASPELLVSREGSVARVRPIAGTRRRGNSEKEDQALAVDLLEDEKERAEHIMLVDLGRNDLGRICETGTVTVQELMVIERYSHVMHIVSDVVGELGQTASTLDLIRATFPAGTLSGAPKVRAMELIDRYETSRRGLYGGAVGFIAPNGDADLAITIRSILLKDGIAYVQAGAGIVVDSDPGREWQECMDKARAALRAIELADLGEF